MPQFDIFSFLNQVFWLLISFFSFFFFCKYFIFTFILNKIKLKKKKTSIHFFNNFELLNLKLLNSNIFYNFINLLNKKNIYLKKKSLNTNISLWLFSYLYLNNFLNK